MPTYDSYQQVFALSMLSNRAAAYTGAPADLQLQLLYELSPYLTLPTWAQTQIPSGTTPSFPTPMTAAVTQMGAWTLEWGPVVFQALPSQDEDRIPVADNAVFVASTTGFVWPDGSKRTVYVVAIAATNPGSEYDWVDEDGTVEPVVEFENGSGKMMIDVTNPTTASKAQILERPLSSFISLGTATGISNILGLNDKTGTGQTLQTFLSKLAPQSPYGLIFTGHSLAGALSPTLALYLQSQLTSNFTVSSDATQNQILVYPTAGATPGGSNFATLFNKTFVQQGARTGYQYWNTDLWNVYDVVPHAWTLQGNTPSTNYLEVIKTIYGQAPTDIVTLVNAAEGLSLASGIIYTPIQNASLAGTLQPCTNFEQPNPLPAAPPPAGTVYGVQILSPGDENYGDTDFLLQLAVQHIGMYGGIPSIYYDQTTLSQWATQPPVTGLILSSMITPPTSKLAVMNNLTPLTGADIIADIEKWIELWLKKLISAAK